MAEVGLLPFARIARQVSKAVLPRYRSRFSKHQFTQPQLLAILCLMRYEDWTFRGSVDILVTSDKWHAKTDRSPMDDSKTVVLSLDSDDLIRGWLDEKKPTLNIRCKEQKTRVYVWTGMAASVEESEYGHHTVKLRLDDGNPMLLYAYESTDHKGLFLGEIDLAKQLNKASKLTFQFTPFNASPAVARFDLRGLDKHLAQVAEACGWTVD